MKTLKIVLTGGPSGGKTTSIQNIEQEFKEKGYDVIIVPEAATILINSGIRPFGPKALSMEAFQEYVMATQLFLENQAEKYAQEKKDKVIILCDRGLMDDKAYVSTQEFSQLLKKFNLTTFTILNRYDLVLHLKTIADGKEELYSNANNKARTETAHEARLLDNKTLNSWLGHEKLIILTNEVNFEEKINRGIKEIYKLLDKPYPLQHQEKYLVSEVAFSYLEQIPHEEFSIEQYYLFEQDKEICLRKTTHENETKYTETIKIDTDIENNRLVKRRNISQKEFLSRLPKALPIIKKRYCFTYNNTYYRLDQFANGLLLLEVEPTNKTKKTTIPPFIKIADYITDSSYRNSTIFKELNSQKQYQKNNFSL